MGTGDRLIAQWERGYGWSEKDVCLDHIREPALRRETESLLSATCCSFCGRQGSRGKAIAAAFDDFMGLVMGAIAFEFGDANDEGMPVDGGEYLGTTYDSFEVVDGLLGWDEVVDDDVLEEVRGVIEDRVWVRKDFALLREDDLLRLNWEDFVEQVKHRSRFWFTQETTPSPYPDPEYLSIEQFFERLEHILEETSGAVQNLPIGSVLYRGRMVDQDATIEEFDATTLGPPPKDHAAANRMSPAGIPMFYGADSVDTVVAEIGRHTSRSHAIVGSFKTARELTIVDLAALPAVPSVFDSKGRSLRYSTRFLRGFADDLAKPVILDGREHIEYVPTQVVTEYLRYAADIEVDGIRFRSTQCEGNNVVLFCDNSKCKIDRDLRRASPLPSSLDDEPWLVLDQASVVKVRVVARPEQA